MAHWAELDKDNIVIRVLKTDNDDPNGDEGYKWLIDNLGGTWVKTSYNAYSNGYRKKFAGKGMYFDEVNDWFIDVQPYDSWIFDEALWGWYPPVEYPMDGKNYFWDETSISWKLEQQLK